MLALAHALETHKTLSGEDVVAVLEHTRGPLVDGSQYGDEDFLSALSEYHQAAVRAHRDHSQVKLSIPMPPTAAAPVAAWGEVIVGEVDVPGWNGHNNPDPS